MRIAPNNSTVVVEMQPFFKIKMRSKYSLESRKEYYYKIANDLKIDKAFVDSLFEREKLTGKKMNIGTTLRRKVFVRKVHKSHVKIPKVKGHKQECTARTSPTCLNVFVTNTDETICVRCK
jgi:hypothetical protein